MDKSLSNRRQFLQLAGASTAVAVTGASSSLAKPEAKDSVRPTTAKEALAKLVTGNKRFIEGKNKPIHITPKQLVELEKGQHPYATVLGCSDSRVPIEMIFDAGFGDLFVIRLAGNVVDTDVEGSLEYAFVHLQTKLIVVLGHEGCGAVTAAMLAKDELEKEPIGIRKLVKQVEPAFKGIDPELPKEKRLHLAVEANVRQSVKQILDYPGHKEANKKGLFQIVGAVYELHTGKVRILT